MLLKNIVQTKACRPYPHPCRVAAIAKDDGTCELVAFLKEVCRPADKMGLWDVFQRAAKHDLPETSVIIDHLSDGIYEYIKGSARVLWFRDEDNGSVIICTHGFIKKKQKTPSSQIEAAKNKRSQYIEAKKNGTLQCDWEN